MASFLTTIGDEAALALSNLTDRARDLTDPTIRLGVTGLSRAGKTVFITALVHNLLTRSRLPLFEAMQSGRISSVHLDPQPDDAVPRFQYEDHAVDMIEKRIWPQSTRAISELRLTIHYESASGWNRIFKPGKLSLDIVDYPGEWLLDLPLLQQDFTAFSKQADELSKSAARSPLATAWRALADKLDPAAPADETAVREIAAAFADYLKACRADEHALSMLPPGRFLMPGDLEGSPALTFAPLTRLTEGHAPKGSLQAMMERRFEAYKNIVVRPFFRNHFARLDRQILIVDTLSAVNRGPEAINDLETALVEILSTFRIGENDFLSSLFTRHIDKVLIAAAKADHLHHESHDRLEAITRRIVQRALSRIGSTGAGIEVLAMASVRATKEARVRSNGHDLPVITGTPIAGETINGETFDGKKTTAIFPGDLPEKPGLLFSHAPSTDADHAPPINVVRFRPPEADGGKAALELSLPHIRLDRALQFLIGDELA